MDILRTAVGGIIGALIVVLVTMFNVPTAQVDATLSGLDPTRLAAAPEVAALRLDYGRELTPARCNGTGSPIIAVTEKIVDTIDSGEAGNYWARDDFTRTIQVWKVKGVEDTYCAVVQYKGAFDAFEGERSPGNTDVLTGNENGPVQGGYAATITGKLLVEPLWNIRGSVGTTDYQCAGETTCPGRVNWVTQYFETDYTFIYDWWGWIYRAGKNNVWVNSSDGNEGDVL